MYILNPFLCVSSFNVIFFSFLAIWLFEWLFFFEYVLNFWSTIYIYFPKRLSILLLLCLVFWLYVWGVSVWRRTQYGKFTRGDRKLWVKGYASFWVVEVVTLTGLLLVACWMSWGPIAYVPRHFWFPKKGFIFELTIFTYVLWIVYLMRLSLKWQLWRTQFLLTLVVILILSLLIWRDVMTLFFKELINPNNGANWRHLKLYNMLYSMSASWWVEHYIGHNVRSNTSLFLPLGKILMNISQNVYLHPFSKVADLKEYEAYNWMPYRLHFDSYEKIGFFLGDEYYLDSLYPRHFKLKNDSLNFMDAFYYSSRYKIIAANIASDSGIFYPRRVGFMPKRIAMWFFLVVLKIWHHFILFIWWFFYLLRLVNRKKGSYTALSLCYFNLYCCFIIGLLVYLYHVLPFLSTFLKYRPAIQSSIFKNILLWEGLSYCFNLLLSDICSHMSLKEMNYNILFSRDYLLVHTTGGYHLPREVAMFDLVPTYSHFFSKDLYFLSLEELILKVDYKYFTFANAPFVNYYYKNFCDTTCDLYGFGHFSKRDIIFKDSFYVHSLFIQYFNDFSMEVKRFPEHFYIVPFSFDDLSKDWFYSNKEDLYSFTWGSKGYVGKYVCLKTLILKEINFLTNISNH